MESDRAKVDLGPDVSSENPKPANVPDIPKQPKKRFVGRRAAAERAERDGKASASIEDNGAIQGTEFILLIGQPFTYGIISCSTKKDCPHPEPSPSRNPQ